MKKKIPNWGGVSLILAGLFALCTTDLMYAQTSRITGTITDESNQPVIGAAVIIKGSANIGATTNIDGKFEISAPGDAVFSVSCIGYESTEVAVNGRAVVDIVLSDDTTLLSEVVVVGYGTQKKVNLSGAVASVKMDEVLGNRPQPNVAAALQGAVPGLMISSGSNTPGQTGKSINIRGTASFSGSSSGASNISPLILIDNVPGDLDELNPNDIESVSVLKDASASAIYGARAAAGVVLITTKHPTKSEKVTINYTGSIAAVNAISTPRQLPLEDYLPIYIEGVSPNGAFTGGANQDINKWLEYVKSYKKDPSSLDSIGKIYDGKIFVPNGTVDRYYLEEEDMYKRMTETGVSHNHNIAVSGATDRIRFRVSASSYNENGPIYSNKDTYSRKVINGFVSADIAKWFTQEVSLYYTHQSKNMFGDERGTVYSNRSMNFLPDDLVTLPTSNDGSTTMSFYYQTPKNAIDQARTSVTNTSTPRVFTKSIFRPLPGLEIDFEYSYNRQGSDYTYYSGTYDFYNVQEIKYTGPTHDYYDYQNYFSTRNSINAYASYTKDFNKHHLKVMAGYNQEYWNYEWHKTYAEDQAVPDIPSISNAQGKTTVQDQYTDYALRSGFARINYDYDGRYIIEISGRYDGSSKFPKKSRFGFFPSFSVAWNVANEPFMTESRQWLSQLKPRFSYGSIGNQSSVGYYDYISSMTLNTTGNVWLDATDKAYTTVIGRPAIVSDAFTWETITTMNAGIDFGFFDNKLTGLFEYYIRDTKNILSESVALPAILGENAPLQNVGALRTNGWEFQLSYKDQIGKDFLYNIGFNIWDYKSKVTSLNFNDAKSLSYLYQGKNLGDIWGYQWDGFYTKDDFSDAACTVLKDGVVGINGVSPRPGDYKFKNLRDGDYGTDDNNMINKGKSTADNPGDLTVIGNSLPRFLFGFNLGMNYKGFGLSMMLQGVAKRDFNAGTSPYFFTFNSEDAKWIPVYEGCDNYWSPISMDPDDPNYMVPKDPNVKLPRIYNQGYVNASSNKETSDQLVLSAAYLRIKNLTLSYSLPKSVVEKIHFQAIRAYVSAENLFTFSALPNGIDPETLSWSYPMYRTVSFGLNLTL